MNIIQRIKDLERLAKEFELEDVMWEIVIPDKSKLPKDPDTIRRVGPIDLQTLLMSIENGLIAVNDKQLKFLVKKLCITMHAYIDETKHKSNARVKYCGEG